MGLFSEIDEREDEYWRAKAWNQKLYEAKEKGWLTEEGYYNLLKDAENNFGPDPAFTLDPPLKEPWE